LLKSSWIIQIGVSIVKYLEYKIANNPYFKSNYADINAMLEQLQPLLNKYKVCIEQPINDSKVFTILTCVDTGQSKSSSLELQLVSDPQKLGSAITYYRRYTLQGLLGIRTKDDDANFASGKNETKGITINEI